MHTLAIFVDHGIMAHIPLSNDPVFNKACYSPFEQLGPDELFNLMEMSDKATGQQVQICIQEYFWQTMDGSM